MRGAVLYAPGDVRVEERQDPRILAPTDAIIRLSATCVCGSDLWPYRGIEAVDGPSPMGHEYAGIVQEIGSQVRNVRPGQFVVGAFFASDNTCPICQAGYQSSCVHREPVGAEGAQAESLRIPLADGTLNVGLGLLNTSKHFRNVNYRRMLAEWLLTVGRECGFSPAGAIPKPRSAPLPCAQTAPSPTFPWTPGSACCSPISSPFSLL